MEEQQAEARAAGSESGPCNPSSLVVEGSRLIHFYLLPSKTHQAVSNGIVVDQQKILCRRVSGARRGTGHGKGDQLVLNQAARTADDLRSWLRGSRQAPPRLDP